MRIVSSMCSGSVAVFLLGCASPGGTAGPTERRAYYAVMESDLRNLAVQEEIYFSNQGAYTYDAASLGYVTSSGVVVTITASRDGWAATATHGALSREDGCAIYHGTATAPTSPAQPTRPGEVVCNRDP